MDKKTYLKKLGANIAKVRRSKGYSQDRIYLEAGFSRGTMSKIEAGIVEPKIYTLVKIAETIGVPISKLLSLE